MRRLRLYGTRPRWTWIILAIPVLILFTTPRTAFAATDISAITLIPRPAAVQLGHQSVIDAILPEGLPENARLEWTVTAGAVTEENGRFLYTPPDHPCRAFVRLAVMVNGSEWGHGATAIQAYHQWVILKADDFTCTPRETYDRWARFLDLAMNTPGLKASAGVVGERVLRPTSEMIAAVHRWHNSGRIEFFNHGWDHAYYPPAPQTTKALAPLPGDDWADKYDAGTLFEFQGISPEIQLEHLQRTQQSMGAIYGITPRSFGAPFNKYDGNTALALANLGGINVWLFGGSKGGLFSIKRGGGEIESLPGIPDLDYFKATYAPGQPMVTLQLHPAHDLFIEGWRNFEAILALLKQQQVTFILPREYADLMHHNQLPADPDALFPDAALECAIREQTGCWTETLDPVLPAALATLTAETPGLPVTRLDGLTHCPNLQFLSARNSAVTSLQPLLDLPASHPLTVLDLRGAPMADIACCQETALLDRAGRQVNLDETACDCVLLTLSMTGNGQITPPPGEYYLPRGSSFIVQANPDRGWYTQLWQGSNGEPGDSFTVALTMNTQRNINVHFASLPPDLPEGEKEGEMPEIEGETPISEGEGEVAAIEGEGPATEGESPTLEGEIPNVEGEGEAPFVEGEVYSGEGEGESLLEGEGEAPFAEGEVHSAEGEGEALAEGEGEAPFVEGESLAEGEGEAPSVMDGFTCHGRHFPEGSFMDRWVAPVFRWLGVPET